MTVPRPTPLAVLLLLICPALTQAQTVWVEGEAPVRSTMNRHPWWYDQVKKDQLSGGDWISNFSDQKDGQAEYQLEVPKAGRYTFWVRANPVQAKIEYRIGTRGKWTPIDMSSDVLDTVNVAADDKPDLRFLAWKKVGEVELTKGKHEITFHFDGTASHHGALDAFVFTTEAFLPSGSLKPGQAVATTSTGTWPFLPERDTFRTDALVDLRSLNEKAAGQSGFVGLSKDGEGFVLGDGSPVRFWAVTTYVQRDKSTEDLGHHARFLAKRGVNMVRLHGHMESHDKDAKLTDADPKAIDQAHKLVVAMKKEGIYTTLSPYWSAELKHVPKSWGLEDWPEDQAPFGLLFFNPKLQEGYKAWLKALLTAPNPYNDGVPLAKDPALAIIQIQNEDSLLFWTEQYLKGKQLTLLGSQFAAWAKTKYGSLDKAYKAWDNDRMNEDNPSKGVLGIYIVWELTQDRTGGKQQRLSDQLQFLSETMYNFNKEIARYLREDLGCKQLVNAGNWKTADNVRLNDAERWSYTANEVQAVNFYYSPTHIGPDNGWRINKGDKFEDASALVNPRGFPLNLKQVVGAPMMITESHWVPPLGYQAEGPFLTAAYQSLTGVDVFYWFGTGEAEWSNTDRSDWDAASRAKWSIATPTVQGQFPAAALMFRKGYIQEGKPVLVEHRSLPQIWEHNPPLIAEDASYDPNRDQGNTARRSNAKTKVSPLAFLAGPVKVAYGADPKTSQVADFSKLIDPARKLVKSDTGQLAWDHGKGLCTLNAPCVQGATGFLKPASPIRLDAITIDTANDYAAVTVISLDGKPIKESARVLVQVGTVARPTGWTETESDFTVNDGKETVHGKSIVSTGKMPWAVVDTKVTLTVANPSLKTAMLLDLNLNARGEIKAESGGGAFKVELPKDTMYAVLSTK